MFSEGTRVAGEAAGRAGPHSRGGGRGQPSSCAAPHVMAAKGVAGQGRGRGRGWASEGARGAGGAGEVAGRQGGRAHTENEAGEGSLHNKPPSCASRHGGEEGGHATKARSAQAAEAGVRGRTVHRLCHGEDLCGCLGGWMGRRGVRERELEVGIGHPYRPLDLNLLGVARIGWAHYSRAAFSAAATSKPPALSRNPLA
jgi:hypothetical protein